MWKDFLSFQLLYFLLLFSNEKPTFVRLVSNISPIFASLSSVIFLLLYKSAGKKKIYYKTKPPQSENCR